MSAIRIAIGFLAAWAVAYVASVGFYTQQILAGYAELGLSTPFSDWVETFGLNLAGQTKGVDSPSWLIILGVAMLIGLLVAAGARRVLKPLAVIAYPVAGAAAVWALLAFIEMQFPGGGVVGGARTGLGVALQMAAGALGGLAFQLCAVRGR